MNKDQVLNALSTLGFIPEEVEDFGYKIEFEGLSIFVPFEEDFKNITLLAPSLFEVTEENRQDVLETLIKLSTEIKFIQPSIIFGDQVSLSYQHFIGENDVTPELLEHMIRVLGYGVYAFYKFINDDSDED